VSTWIAFAIFLVGGGCGLVSPATAMTFSIVSSSIIERRANLK
jgi:hypothetical protein